MIRNRGWWAVVIGTLASMQAWDSGVLQSTALVQGIVAMAIALILFALLFISSYGTQAGAVAVCFVLLTAARIISPSPLPTLHLIGFFPAILLFLGESTGALRREDVRP